MEISIPGTWTVSAGGEGDTEVWMRSATPFLDVGELESKWYFQNMATRSYSLIWCVPVGLNSCRLRVCGASVNPFKRWHSRLGVISGPPTLRVACDRVCPVGAALKVVSCAAGGGSGGGEGGGGSGDSCWGSLMDSGRRGPAGGRCLWRCWGDRQY